MVQRSLRRLSRRQIAILAALFASNVIVLLGGWRVVRETTLAGAAPSAAPANCQAIGAQLLVWRDLAGAARLDADDTIRFELSGRDAAGHPLPRASEAAWDVLAAAMALPDAGCGPYRLVRVDVPAPNGPVNSRLLVEANWIDLRAWNRGELDDGELAAQVRAISYVRPDR